MPSPRPEDERSARQGLPLVFTCDGGSRLARLANEVAERLDRLGVAEMSSTVALAANVESCKATTIAGRRVIAMDGCRHACCSRLLEAKRVRPWKVVRLDRLVPRSGIGSADRERAVKRVLTLLKPAAVQASALAGGRRDRKRQRSPSSRYLRTIRLLAAREKPLHAANVSRALGLTRPSVGEMLRRLEQDGLLERGEHGEIRLTRAGETAADRAVRRRSVAERFLTEYVGYRPDRAAHEADRVADALSEDMTERLARALG